MYFHASSVKGIKVLTPCVSNHNVSLIYFSKKRENVLVYLSNAVETITDSGFQLQIPDAATSRSRSPIL